MHSLQCRRHIAVDHAIGETLNHRRLAHTGLSGQNRIVLTPPHQNVDHLANFLVAAQHRVNLPRLGIRGQVHRVLIQMGRLAARGRAGAGSVTAAFRCSFIGGAQSGLCLSGCGNNVVKAAPQPLRRDGLQFPADVLHHPGQFLVAQQRKQREARADISRVEIDTGDGPRLGKHLDHGRTERGRARIAALQGIQAALQLLGQS